MCQAARTLTVFALSICACAKPNFSDRGMRVSLTVDRTLFHPGDKADIAVTALNRGGEVVRITTNGCPAVFVVIDARDSVVMPGHQVCLLYLAQRDLRPGESYVFRYTWRFVTAKGDPLPLGEYKLRGHVYGEHLWAESQSVPIRIEKY